MGTDRRRQKESTKPVIEDAVADDLSPIINIKRPGQFPAKPLLDHSIQILQHSLVVQKCMLSVCGRRNSDNLGVIIDGKGDCFPGARWAQISEARLTVNKGVSCRLICRNK